MFIIDFVSSFDPKFLVLFLVFVIFYFIATRIQKHGAAGIIYAVLHECELISSCLMNTSKRLKRFFHVGKNSVQPELS